MVAVPILLLGVSLLPRTQFVSWRLSHPRVYCQAEEERDPGFKLAQCLARHAERGDRVVAATVGRVAFYSGLTVLDLHGLTNPQVARQPNTDPGLGLAGHEKFGLTYLLQFEPRFIVLTRALMPGTPSRPAWLDALARWVTEEERGRSPRRIAIPESYEKMGGGACFPREFAVYRRIDSGAS